MATTTRTKATRDLAPLVEDVAAADALRSTWSKRGGTRRSSRTRPTASACSCDDCEAQPAQAGEPSALVNSAWLGNLVTMLRTRANELEEVVTHHRACLNELTDPERRERERDAAHETMQAYTILARELRVAAVRAERQAEDEQAVMRDAVNRMHLAAEARPGFAFVG